MSHTPITPSPFERDITDQPAALRTFAQELGNPGLSAILRGPYQRIVLTGMGSSHFAALPTWRRLVAAGLPAWWVDTGQLLDSPELITDSTLLVITSQSGASGEVVALLERGRKATIVAVTNDPSSPLGSSAAHLLALHSGTEATVSTKSYLNTLAAHWLIAATMTGVGSPETTAADALLTATEVEGITMPAELESIAGSIAGGADHRVVFVGFADHAATALYAGLITKEAAKVPAEGFVGGQFRHGPLELAGPGLCAVLFAGDDTDPSQEPLRNLSRDLVSFGSTVITVGTQALPASLRIPSRSGHPLAQLAHGAVLAQHLAVAIARAHGVTPGAFSFGNKVTNIL